MAHTANEKKYALGSIAIGYNSKNSKPDSELDSEFQSFFNIVGNHIAINLSSQIIMDNNDSQFYLKLRLEQNTFISEFFAKFLDIEDNKAHQQPLDYKEDKLDEFYKKEENSYDRFYVDNLFGEGFTTYIKQVLRLKNLDWGMYQGYQDHSEISYKVNDFYKNLIDIDGFGYDLKLMQSHLNPAAGDIKILKPFVNIYLPHLIISKLKNDLKRPLKKIETRIEGAKFIIKVYYTKIIEIEKILSGFATDKREGTNGSFIDFLKSNYDIIRTSGNLIIKTPLILDNPVINLKENFKKDSNEKFVFTGFSNNIQGSDIIEFEIHNNLFN